MKPILSVAEVAELFDTDSQNVRRWCRDGDLPSVKIGRTYRISTAALVTWWREQGGGELKFTSDDLQVSPFSAGSFPVSKNESDANSDTKKSREIVRKK